MKYIILYLPFLTATMLSFSPEYSYLVAWSGSFLIFILSIGGVLKPLPEDLPFSAQFMRPLILTQIIFGSYMAITSIFYFMDSLGYYYFTYDGLREPDSYIDLLAQCQRYYVLAHGAYVHGLLLLMNYKKKPMWQVPMKSVAGFMLKLTVWFTVVAFIAAFIPGMSQFRIKFAGLAFVASVIGFAFALPERKSGLTLITGALFTYNMTNAVVSGWKEEIIVPLIMLGVFLFPYYKWAVISIFPVVLFLFFMFVPTYNQIVQGLSWSGQMSGKEAASVAMDAIEKGDVDLARNNWAFLTGRLSEIGMFTDYVMGIPKLRDFYGIQIAKQAVLSIVPRVFYPSKPITENMVMDRVIAAGVVDAESIVSAKPPMVTDAYLSAGAFGILVFMFCLGMLISWISVTAENFFGGYLLGSGLIYTGLFPILWRGNCFEFLANSVFWSIIVMYVLFYIGKKQRIIQPAERTKVMA